MKKILFTLWFPLTLLACSTKNDVPPPDAGTVVSGNYTLQRVASFANDQPVYDIVLPQTVGTNTRTGTLEITRTTENTVSVRVIQQVNGASGTTTGLGKMEVKATGNGYELAQYDRDNGRTGTGAADGTTISLDLSDTYLTTVTRYVLVAKR